MRRLLVPLVTTLLVLAPAAALAGRPGHHHKKPKADLLVTSVQASLTGQQLSVQVEVTDKGRRKARASSTGIYLSADVTHDATDAAMGSIATPSLKPRKSVSVQASFTVPESVPGGSYHVVACADAAAQVKEKHESDNCTGVLGTVTVVPVVHPVTVTLHADYGGSISGTVVSGAGSCVTTAMPTGPFKPYDGACTVTPGSTLKLVATTFSGEFFLNAWKTGPQCQGTAAGNTLTLTGITGPQQCVADFDSP